MAQSRGRYAGLLMVLALFNSPTAVISDELDHELALDDDDLIFNWFIDWANEDVMLELTGLFKDKYQWFALGFSHRGDPGRTDYCIFYSSPEQGGATDAYSSADGRVISKDEYQQDWRILQQDEDHVLFKRKFNTNDWQDVQFTNGSIYISYVRGEDRMYLPYFLHLATLEQESSILATSRKSIPTASLSRRWAGSSSTRGKIMIHLLAPQPVVNIERDYLTVDIMAQSIIIPTSLRYCMTRKLSDIGYVPHHIIGWEALREANSSVKFIALYKCKTTRSRIIPIYSGPCDDVPPEANICHHTLAMWNYGSQPFRFPRDVGLPFADEEHNPYVLLGMDFYPPINYNTRENVGLRLMVVDKLRKHNVGILKTGVQELNTMAIPTRQVAFPILGYCHPECTRGALPEEGINVFATYMSAHKEGVRVVTDHYREDQPLGVLSADDYFNHDLREIRILPEEIKVLPGDSLVTTCYFDTKNKDETTIFESKKNKTICANYVYYYPAGSLSRCTSSMSFTGLTNFFKSLNMTDTRRRILHFEEHDYNAVTWNHNAMLMLYKAYTEEHINVFCNRQDGEQVLESESQIFNHKFSNFPIEAFWKFQKPKKACSVPWNDYLNSGACDMFCNCIYE